MPGCGCECLDFDSHQVFLFVSNSLAESADAIYRAYSQNWLSPPHVILFNNELFFINLVNLRDVCCGKARARLAKGKDGTGKLEKT